MKEGKLTKEDFPLHKVVSVVDADGKTSNNCFQIPYMQRSVTMYDHKTPWYSGGPKYSGEPLSNYMDRSQDKVNGEIKITALSHASCFEDVRIPARYNELPEIPGLDTALELRNALINELIRDVTRKTLKELFYYGEYTRQSARGFWEKLFAFFNNSHVKRYTINSHKDLIRLLNSMRADTVRRSGLMADYIVTNVRVGAVLADMAGYIVSQDQLLATNPGVAFPAGSIGGMTIYVDPNMSWNDCRMLVGASTKNNLDGLYCVFDSQSLRFDTVTEAPKSPADKDETKTEAILKVKIALLRNTGESMPECCVAHLNITKNVL